jgi:hypothetical protein
MAVTMMVMLAMCVVIGMIMVVVQHAMLPGRVHRVIMPMIHAAMVIVIMIMAAVIHVMSRVVMRMIVRGMIMIGVIVSRMLAMIFIMITVISAVLGQCCRTRYGQADQCNE